MRIRCESYSPLPRPVTQCYKCQGFNHVTKDCKSEQNVLDVLVPINPLSVQIKIRNLLNLNV